MKKLSDYEYHREPAGVIYCGDCLEILPLLPNKSIDLVLKKDLTNSIESIIVKHEKQKRLKEETGGKETMGGQKKRDLLALQQSKLVVVENSELLRDIANGYGQGSKEIRDSIKRKGENREAERQIYRWDTKHTLSTDDREGQMFQLWEDGIIGNSSQKREPPRQSTGQSSNSLREMSQQTPSETLVENSQIICITDNLNQTILDPFLGSGTTAVAAKQLGRKFIDIDISKKYCEIAKQRLAQEELF